ncbi:hypothetical protein HGA34_03710 [Candidatus Falkowbacteria bacterium]|nr:hypothetical protein [Candidatus Falkowbacteria bacterium]
MFLKDQEVQQVSGVTPQESVAKTPNFKKIIVAALACLVVAGAGLAAFSFLSSQNDATGKLKLSLSVKGADLNGIEKGAAFILSSNKKLSAGEIEKNLKFDPQVKFEAKEKKSLLTSLVNSVLAASQGGAFNNEYELTPKEELSDGVIYKIQTATGTEMQLDHDYSWAFNVKEDFDIDESLPNNEATGVPVNTGIEVTMNRLDIGSDAGKYFAIEPSIKGRFEVGINKITFVPEGDLKEKTLYKVTIKKGYQAGEKNEELMEDKSFSFETATGDSGAYAPSMSWGNDYFELSTDKEGFLEASGDATTSEAVFSRYADTAGFLKDFYDYRDRMYGWSNFNKEPFKPGSGVQEVAKFRPELLKRAEGDSYGLIKLPRKLDAGFYVAKLSVGDDTDYAFIRVSPLAYYYSEINGDGLIWAYDFANKKPFASVRVSLLDKAGTEKQLGQTDNDGLLKFDSSSDKDDNSGTTLLFKGEGVGETVAPDAGRIMQKRRNYFQGYLNTDRYAYRLTDTVHFWGVVKGRSFDLRQKKVKVRLDDYIEKEVMVSPFDTIEGQLDFAGLPSGYHNLVVSYDDETITQSGIEVFSFEKPLYKIEVVPEKSFSVTDVPVKAKVKVNFFDGTPVKNMDLNYSIYWRGDNNGTVRTNDQGEAELSYTPGYYFEETSDQYSDSWTTYPNSLRFSVKPQLPEEGEIWGEAYVSIYAPKVYLQSEASEKGNALVFKSKANDLELATSSEENMIGRPAVGIKVLAKVVRYYYEERPDGEYYDPIEKVKIKKFVYELKKETVKEAEGTSDQKGEWSVEVDKKEIKKFGYLKTIFSTQDSNGKKVMSSAQSYNYYPNDNSALNLENADLEKTPGISYKIGDKVNLRVVMTGTKKPVDDRTLIISFQERLRDAKLVSKPEFSEDFSAEHLPSMTYMAVKMMPSGFIESYYITASYKDEENKLSVEIAPNKERYKPREDINLDITIKNKSDQGVKAVANVAAVDESLFSVTPWGYGGEILSSLYSDIMAYPNSLSTRYVIDYRNGAEKGGCFVAGTEINLADGTKKKIEELRVGDEVSTFEKDNSPTRAKSVIQGISSHLVDGYLVINGQLKVTPEHKIMVSGEWKMAGAARVGDLLANDQGESEKISEIRYVGSRNARVYNIIVGRYHTYFAQGYYVHNAEKGGGGDVRNFFEDTPLYKQIESDDNGQLKASFRVPDNLTSWRVSVNAYSPESFSAGSQDKLIPVGLPLFADAVAARKYLTGDSPIIKVRAFGTEYKKNEPIEFSVTSDSLKLQFATTTSLNEVAVSLGRLPKGRHSLILRVKQGELKDALEKKFEVIDNYFKELKTDSRLITDGQAGLKGNSGSFTDIVFVDEGKGKFFERLLGLNWQSSVRSDIQSASYLAAKTLDEYFYGGEKKFSQEISLAGYQSRENGSGPLAVFPYSKPNLALTAEIADAMPESFDNSWAINGLEARLREQKLDDKETAQALWALAALDRPQLPLINYLKDSASTSLEAKVYLALALSRVGDVEGARALYFDQLLPQTKADGGQAHLEVSAVKEKNVKVTAIFGVLVSRMEAGMDGNNLKSIMNYLSANQPKDDTITLEEAMITRSEIAKADQSDSSLDFRTSDRNGKIDLSKGQSFQLTISEQEMQTLSFSNIKGSARAISYYEDYADPAKMTTSKSVSVERQYLVNGKEATEFNEGDLITIRLTPRLSAEAPDDSYQLVEYLPSVFKPIVRDYSPDMQTGSNCDPIWYPVRTTDEAVYFSIGKWFQSSNVCQQRTINFRARAIGKGSFKAQPAAIQSLNDVGIMNLSKERTVIVK